MAQAMIKNKARERIVRIEDTHLDKLKDAKSRERLIETILNQIDETYSQSRMITEDELRKELGNVLG